MVEDPARALRRPSRCRRQALLARHRFQRAGAGVDEEQDRPHLEHVLDVAHRDLGHGLGIRRDGELGSSRTALACATLPLAGQPGLVARTSTR